MITGIYSARYISNTNQFGAGIMVIDGATMHGGDPNYSYRGKYRLTDTAISATVDVENYTGNLNAVVGPLKSFRLTLTGTAAPRGFSLSGSVDGDPHQTIQIALTKIGDLVDQ